MERRRDSAKKSIPRFYTSTNSETSRVDRLTLEDEAGTNLVAGFVELLGVKGGTDAQGHARVDLGVVGEGEDTGVVDLSL